MAGDILDRPFVPLEPAALQAENERLKAELAATQQKLAEATKAAPSVSVPVGPAAGEGTPLVPPVVEAQPSGVVAMGKAVNENKVAAGSCSQSCLGFLFAFMCLLVYYLNGGDNAKCSTKLPLFLKVNGYSSLAYLIATAVIVAIATRGRQAAAEQPNSFKCLGCLVSLLGCFLFAWLICGLVRTKPPLRSQPRSLPSLIQSPASRLCIHPAPHAEP